MIPETAALFISVFAGVIVYGILSLLFPFPELAAVIGKKKGKTDD